MILLRFILGLIAFGLIMNQAEACGQTPVRVVESVDTRDLKFASSFGAQASVDIGHEGSTPSSDTINRWWVTMPITSWHKEEKPYNEKNLGIGFEYKFNNNYSL